MSKDEDASNQGANETESRLSRASVGRLSLYLRRLEILLREGTTKVSSGILGEALGVKSRSVRVLLFRARKRLAEMLRRSGIGPEALR